MNWLDLILLLTLVWFTIAGATAGLPREAVTLIAMLLGVVLAGVLHDQLAAELIVMVDSKRTARVIGFAAIFFAVFGAGQIASVLLKGIAQTLALGPLNHSGGFVVGLFKGVILIEATLFVFARYHFQDMVEAIDGSLFTPFFLRGIPFLLALLPADFRAAVDRFPAPL